MDSLCVASFRRLHGKQRIKVLPKTIFAITCCAAIAVCAATTNPKADNPDAIGIFDLKTIRSVPLSPEVLRKSKQGEFTVEEVRFTSLPGVRVYMVLTYKEGMHRAPGFVVVDRFHARPQPESPQNGYFGVSVAPPDGNMDPNKSDTVGGPSYREPFSIDDTFVPDKNNSYIYQYTVALLRALDYLATRPEVDLARTAVSGYSWSGTPVMLLHALDDRVGAFCTLHGLGYYVDEAGHSYGLPVALSREQYEMYCPAAYATHGTKPMYVGVALDDMYTKLDAVMEAYAKVKGQKIFAYSPNRCHDASSRNEFFIGNNSWISYWLGLQPEKPPTLGEGSFKVLDGKLTYDCLVDAKYPLVHSELLLSYGVPGNWMGRTWHRIPFARVGNDLHCEIPVYDPSVPFYAIAQIETSKYGAVGNGPQFLLPSKLGLDKPTDEYPTLLFDPSLKDDLYIRTGVVQWSSEGPTGTGSAVVALDQFTPDNSIIFQNVDAIFWRGKKTLSIWLKGDGQKGPVTVYMASNPNWYLEADKKNYLPVELVGRAETFSNEWAEYLIPLTKIPNLGNVSSLFLYTEKKRALQIGPITLK